VQAVSHTCWPPLLSLQPLFPSLPLSHSRVRFEFQSFSPDMPPRTMPSRPERSLSNAAPPGAAAASSLTHLTNNHIAKRSAAASAASAASSAAAPGSTVRKRVAKRITAAPVNWKTNITKLAETEGVGTTARANAMLAMIASEFHRRAGMNMYRMRRSHEHYARVPDMSMSVQKKRQAELPMRDTPRLIAGAVLTTCMHFPPQLLTAMLRAQQAAKLAYEKSYAASAAATSAGAQASKTPASSAAATTNKKKQSTKRAAPVPETATKTPRAKATKKSRADVPPEKQHQHPEEDKEEEENGKQTKTRTAAASAEAKDAQADTGAPAVPATIPEADSGAEDKDADADAENKRTEAGSEPDEAD
jgi:hypothetical protein